jgi:hypothetical protein
VLTDSLIRALSFFVRLPTVRLADPSVPTHQLESVRSGADTYSSLISHQILRPHSTIYQMEDIEDEDVILIDLRLFRQRSESEEKLEVSQFV